MADPLATIRAHADDQWTAAPIEWPNEVFTRPDGPWLKLDVSADIFQQQSIGGGQPTSNYWRESGQLIVNLYLKVGAGTSDGRTMLRQFADLFRGQDIGDLTFGSVQLGPGGEQDAGSWFILPMMIDWQRDEEGS